MSDTRDYRGALYYLMTETHQLNNGIIPLAQSALDDLEVLVKRNEPMKVTESGKKIHTVICPNCKKEIDGVWWLLFEEDKVDTIIKPKGKFCPECGQALK